MPRNLRVAIQTAVGKKGVSVVVLPGDLAAEESGGPTLPSAMVSEPSPVRPAVEQVQARDQRGSHGGAVLRGRVRGGRTTT